MTAGTGQTVATAGSVSSCLIGRTASRIPAAVFRRITCLVNRGSTHCGIGCEADSEMSSQTSVLHASRQQTHEHWPVQQASVAGSHTAPLINLQAIDSLGMSIGRQWMPCIRLLAESQQGDDPFDPGSQSSPSSRIPSDCLASTSSIPTSFHARDRHQSNLLPQLCKLKTVRPPGGTIQL